MAIVSGKNVGKEIAEALGFGGKFVRRVVLDVNIRDAVKAYVETLVDGSSLVTVIDLLKKKPDEFHEDSTIEVGEEPPYIVSVRPKGETNADRTHGPTAGGI